MQNKISREYLLKSHEEKLLTFEEGAIASVKAKIEDSIGRNDVVEVFENVSPDDSSFNFEYFLENDISTYPKNNDGEIEIALSDVERCVLEVVPMDCLLTEGYEPLFFTIIFNTDVKDGERENITDVYTRALGEILWEQDFLAYSFVGCSGRLKDHLAVKKVGVKKFLITNPCIVSLLSCEKFALDLQARLNDKDSDYILIADLFEEYPLEQGACPLLKVFIKKFLKLDLDLSGESTLGFFEEIDKKDFFEKIDEDTDKHFLSLAENDNVVLIDCGPLAKALAHQFVYGRLCGQDLTECLNDATGICDWISSLEPTREAIVINWDLAQD
jgi:hypothetical protein